ncbi:MAG TPA: PLP-dependent aminotransferase family protein [Candidatus Acidoferrales bacterium]|nr:PLP-dependent aminotransferase family protein [Candidatus Acidoferrales bacterium]
MLPLHLQPESHIPLYIQLRDQLRSLVHAGDLRPGDRIPASRELATILGVHRTTVANAYAELESEGLIQGHVGRGTFIRGNGDGLKLTPPAPPVLNGNHGIRWELLFADDRGEEVLTRLTAGTPEGTLSFVMARPAQEFFPVEELQSCVAAALRREGNEILNLGPSDGYPPLKEGLLELLRRDGIVAKDENLLVTDGCQQSLDLISKAFIRPGDSIVLENPTYPGAVAIFTGARARCLGVPVHTQAAPGTPLGIDLEALEATLAANRVKLIILTPDFQNPTGTSLPLESRRKILELATRYQVPIVEDHIYSRLYAHEERLPSLKQLDRGNVVMHIDSFSKVAFPGLRVGWIVGPPTAIERLRVVKQTTDLHTDQLAQATLAEFLRRGLFAKHVARMRKVYASRLRAVDEALRKHMPEGSRWTCPDGGMCLWLELPLGFDASELLIHARERGVLFAPGRYFYVQSPLPNTLRLGFAGLDEKQISRAIATLAELLRIEMRKRQRGVRRAERSRVALV